MVHSYLIAFVSYALVFVKAIHALGKIGDEIYFEWIDEGVRSSSALFFFSVF